MRTFIENYLHFMKNCIEPHYEKLKPLKSGFIENSNFENNRDPCQNLDHASTSEQPLSENGQIMAFFHNFWSSAVMKRFDFFNFCQLFWRDFVQGIQKIFLKKTLIFLICNLDRFYPQSAVFFGYFEVGLQPSYN